MTNCQINTQSDKLVQAMPEPTVTEYCDVLIIGAGLAGLSTALSLPSNVDIILLAKEDLKACSSHYAQGGIAAVIDKEDSVTEHVSDTLIAGDGLCNVLATTHILAQGATAIEWLLDHDVPFTTKNNTTKKSTINNSATHNDTSLNDAANNGTTIAQHNTTGSESSLSKNATLAELHLTQEGGHSRRRVAHAEDATGKHIMHALHQEAAAAPNIHVLPYHEALSLITEQGLCKGAFVVDTQTNTLIAFKSSAVVLASGGLGQLFSRATAPNVCVGDGIMMAWEVGARLANLEFIQFHPTGLVYSDKEGESNFLISEAVRGEGGYLYDPITGKRFMPDYDERAELAPRDIVARAIANEIAKNKLGYVHLDISHQPAEFIQNHFPDIYAHCLSLGIDITTDPIPVAPTAHYTCGGVLTNASGLTDIKGLYAAGEVANTGLHGANRLASNSLLECVVVGREIANHLPKYLQDSSDWQAPHKDDTANLELDHQVQVHQVLSHKIRAHQILRIPTPSNMLEESTYATDSFINLDLGDVSITNITSNLLTLKQLMTTHMGIRRNETSLKQALMQVLLWKKQLQTQSNWNDNQAKFDKNMFRLNRLLSLATLLLQSAITRLESRGGHYRDDYPCSDDKPAMSIIYPCVSKPLNSKPNLLNDLANEVLVNNSLVNNDLTNDALNNNALVNVDLSDTI